MSKEMMSAVHAGEKPKLRDRLSEKNKARLATGAIGWQHLQTGIGTVAAGGLALSGAFVPAAAVLGYSWIVNEGVEVPIAQRYRNIKREKAGLEPKKQRKVLGVINAERFGGKKKGAHHVHQEVATVHQLPQRRTLFQASDRSAA